jgi:DNA invertase Pin-like site-specific DNA recombinase
VEDALAQAMHASGESASTTAATLGVSRATVYRVIADDTRDNEGVCDAASSTSGSRAVSFNIN